MRHMVWVWVWVYVCDAALSIVTFSEVKVKERIIPTDVFDNCHQQ